MKRHIPLLAIYLVCFLFLGCTVSEVSITQGRHLRETGYMVDFRTYSLQLEGVTVQMEARGYEESTLKDAAQLVEADLSALTAVGGAPVQEVEVYLVEETVSGLPQTAAGHVFCTVSDVKDGSYRPALAQAAFSFPKLWQSVGLASYVFDAPVEEAALKSYCEDPETGLILSLFELYFSPVFADGETCLMARQAARSITAYWVEQEGFVAFSCLEDPAEAVASWAEQQEITPPSLPQGASSVAQLSLSTVQENQMVLQGDGRFIWYLEPMDWISTASDFYQKLCRYYAGADLLLEEMEAALPRSFAAVKAIAEEEIAVELVPSDTTSLARPADLTIILGAANTFWHELTHVLTPSPLLLENSWLCEGLATLFAGQVETKYGMIHDVSTYRYLTDGTVFGEKYPQAAAQQADIIERYTKKAPLPQNSRDIDAVLFYRVCGISTLLHPEWNTADGLMMNWKSSGADGFLGATMVQKASDGNYLTYSEAMLFIEYLAELHGLDTVAGNYLKGLSFEEAYGVSYAEGFAAFYDWLLDTYEV